VNGLTTTYTATKLTGLSAGTKTLVESDVAGYTEGTWDCTGAAGAVVGTFNAGSVVLANGEDVTCEITNNDDASSLTVVKRIVNANGGTNVVGDFGITTSAGALTFDAGAADGANTLKYTSDTIGGLSAGTAYTLHEDTVTGYTEGTWSCDVGTVNPDAQNGSVTLANGQSATCTITNNDQAASLTVVKRIVNDNGGTKVVGDFGITTSAGALSFDAGAADGANTLKYTSDTIGGLSAGSKTLHEDTVTGYSEGTWSCVGAAGAVNGNAQTGSVVLGNGESVTCTITNNDQPPSLTLNKIVSNNNGGTAAASNWTLTADGGAAGTLSGLGAPGSADVVSEATFQAGTYNLSETGSFPGYTNGTTYSCVKNGGASVAGNTITLAVGDAATCSITNDDIPPLLTLVKTVTNESGGEATAGNWTLRATGPITISGATESPAVTNREVSAGNYTLSETGPPGYTASAWSCVGGTQNGANITLALGESATCTINNHDNPALMPLTKLVNGRTPDCSTPNPNQNPQNPFDDFICKDPVTQAVLPQYTFNLYNRVSFSADYPGLPFDLDPGAGYIPASLNIPPDIEIPAPLNHGFTLCEMGVANGTLNGGGLPADWVSLWTVSITSATNQNLNGDSQLSNPLVFYPPAISPATTSEGRTCISFTLPTAASGGHIRITINNTQMGHIIVDKVTVPSGDLTSFHFAATGTGYVDFDLTDFIQPANTVNMLNDQTLISGTYGVRELAPIGWKVFNIVCVNSVGTVSTFRVTGSGGQPNSIFDMGDDRVQIELAPAEIVTCTFTNTIQTEGRMTGGGSILPGRGTRITHGFELHCDPATLPNSLEINWAGTSTRQNQFHLESLTSATCTDDLNINQRPPWHSNFDTFTGTGVGRFNGTSGYTINFIFTDYGEPGSDDTALYWILAPDGSTVLGPVFGKLQQGNHQAH
jgi:predicted porin